MGGLTLRRVAGRSERDMARRKRCSAFARLLHQFNIDEPCHPTEVGTEALAEPVARADSATPPRLHFCPPGDGTTTGPSHWQSLPNPAAPRSSLPPCGWTLLDAEAINDYGDIVGAGDNAQGQKEG